MKKLLIIALLFLLSGCSNLAKSDVSIGAVVLEDSSYGWSYGGYSFYEGGLLIKEDTDTVWVFDAKSKQMVPLCTRPECAHEGDWSEMYETSCPASYLARKAAVLGIYENQIWYLCETDSEWEVWTADLTGENHQFVCEVQGVEMASPRGETLFYQGHCYTMMSELLINEETGETKFQTALISVDLDNGELTRLTKGTDPWQSLTLVGAYENTLFYSIVAENETGVLVRNVYGINLDSGDEVLALVSSGIVKMSENRMAYTERDGAKSKVMLQELSTGTKTCVYETEEATVSYLNVINGRVLFRNMSDEEVYGPWHIYHIENDELYLLPIYEMDFANLLCVEDGWFLSVNVGPFETEYYYIEENDFITGMEPTRVK